MLASLRTQKTEDEYQHSIAEGILKQGCALCEKTPLKEFGHWVIVLNDFPYDRIAKTHHMLIPKRHATEVELSQEEWGELPTIKEAYIHPNYDYMLEATHKIKSIPAHLHIHLIELKAG